MSTVLVTGGGGFVGSAVVRRLARPGAELWDGSAVDRVVALLRPEGSLARLETLAPDDPWAIERADVHDVAALRTVLRRWQPRAVVNAALDAAVYVGGGVGRTPLEALSRELASAGGERVVHTGSAWVLAPGVDLDETAPVDPRSPYARHKAAEDELLPIVADRAGVDWINLRLFNVFGRYEKPSRLVPHLVARLSRGEPADVSAGDQLRDFNDVDEIAEAFVLALRAPPGACGDLYHIGSGRATTVRELALAVAEVAGDPEAIRFGAGRTPDQDLPALVAKSDRAQRVLGWRPERSLEARVRAAAEWWIERLARTAGYGERHEERIR